MISPFELKSSESRSTWRATALCYAREIGYLGLDVAKYLFRLDELSAEAGEAVGSDAPVLLRAERLADFLFGQAGFQGNSANYSDPRNSYLNEVT